MNQIEKRLREIEEIYLSLPSHINSVDFQNITDIAMEYEQLSNELKRLKNHKRAIDTYLHLNDDFDINLNDEYDEIQKKIYKIEKTPLFTLINKTQNDEEWFSNETPEEHKNMSKIDIRNDKITIDTIQYAGRYSEPCDEYAAIINGRSGRIQIALGQDSTTYNIISGIEETQDLIKALQKAIELGWV